MRLSREVVKSGPMSLLEGSTRGVKGGEWETSEWVSTD